MSSPASDSLVVFTLDEQTFALSLEAVTRVVRAVEITPLPEAPAGVRGVINVQGEIMPVFDPRLRRGMAPRELRLCDQFIIVRTDRRTVALLADAVVGVVRREDAEVTPAADILPGFAGVEGVMPLDGGLVLIHDINRFLTLRETDALETALEARQA
jgi:purine-binding chemotaxis protein CheW